MQGLLLIKLYHVKTVHKDVVEFHLQQWQVRIYRFTGIDLLATADNEGELQES